MKLKDLTEPIWNAIKAVLDAPWRKRNVIQNNCKLESMIWHITQLCEGHSIPLTKTKLNKLLFLSDFASYKLTGSSISGEKYYKNHYGPTIAIQILEPAINNKVDTQKVRYNGFECKKITTKNTSKLGLPEKDKKLIQQVVDEFENYSASALSELTHKFPGWRFAKGKMDEIPYETALLSKRRLTNEEMRKARKHAGIAGKYLSVH